MIPEKDIKEIINLLNRYKDNGDYYIIEMWEKLKKGVDKSDNVC